MPLDRELTDLFDGLMVGCLQLDRFQDMTAQMAQSLAHDETVPSAALETLDEFLRHSQEETLEILLEDTGETLSLSREEAAYLHRLTNMGLEIEVRYPRLAGNMIIIYLTTLFEAYVQDSIAAVAHDVSRNLRRGGGQEGAEAAGGAAWPMVNDLLVRLLRRQVTDLAFRSIQVKLRFVEETLGVDLRDCPPTPTDLDELYATRNLLVHNGGIVNNKYLQIVRGSTLRVGEPRPIDEEYVRAAIATVQVNGECLYRALMSRYTGTSPEARLERARHITERLASLLSNE